MICDVQQKVFGCTKMVYDVFEPRSALRIGLSLKYWVWKGVVVTGTGTRGKVKWK